MRLLLGHVRLLLLGRIRLLLVLLGLLVALRLVRLLIRLLGGLLVLRLEPRRQRGVHLNLRPAVVASAEEAVRKVGVSYVEQGGGGGGHCEADREGIQSHFCLRRTMQITTATTTTSTAMVMPAITPGDRDEHVPDRQ